MSAAAPPSSAPTEALLDAITATILSINIEMDSMRLLSNRLTTVKKLLEGSMPPPRPQVCFPLGPATPEELASAKENESAVKKRKVEDDHPSESQAEPCSPAYAPTQEVSQSQT